MVLTLSEAKKWLVVWPLPLVTEPAHPEPSQWLGEGSGNPDQDFERSGEDPKKDRHRNRYVKKGGDSGEEGKGNRRSGKGTLQTRRQADSGDGELNAPFLQGPWPKGCLLNCQACPPQGNSFQTAPFREG